MNEEKANSEKAVDTTLKSTEEVANSTIHVAETTTTQTDTGGSDNPGSKNPDPQNPKDPPIDLSGDTIQSDTGHSTIQSDPGGSENPGDKNPNPKDPQIDLSGDTKNPGSKGR